MAERIPIERGVVARLTGALSGAIRGATEGWFGPRQPLPALAPPEVRGRAFDYPVAVNTVIAPRSEGSESGLDFRTLRRLADPALGGLDLLRLAIETRKDQLSSQKWALVGRDGGDGGEKARRIEKALRRPDGVHTWRQWQRMLVEDVLVTDAPAIYLEPGGPAGCIPQVMDGTTLKRLVSPSGRIPMPPEPAYQQNLKGLPAVDYTLDEVVYHPRNLRSDRLYGMSPVEQVISTVNLALRRQLSQLEYYTAGSVPDVVFGVPDTWTSDQIKAFQGWWDSILSGNTEERRRARFVPGGVTPTMLKPDQLKDAFDEWLARVICYAFSLPPSALVKEVNRATAETSKESAQEEGLEPLKDWNKDLIDDVLERGFDAPELELAWQDEEIVDAETKAKVWTSLVGKPIATQDEGRAAFGLEPMTPEQRAELLAQPGAPMLGEGEEPVEEPTEALALPDPTADVQATAFNGAQVSALAELLAAVAGGKLPAASARAAIMAAFPAVPPATVDAMLAGLEGFAPAAPAPQLPAPAEPPETEEPEEPVADAEEKLASLVAAAERLSKALERQPAARRVRPASFTKVFELARDPVTGIVTGGTLKEE